jgi:hypothetical protein
MYADSALRDEELQAVRSHLADCPACRRELDEQGALDMLLKSPFLVEPSESTFDSLWPSVAERIDGAPPGEEKPSNGGGSPQDGEIVFKSSSAMQLLNIPERPAPVVSKPGAPPPEPVGSPWRWPVALIFSTAILVAGFIGYKKLVEPPPSGQATALAPGGESKLGPADQPASSPSTQPVAVAMATVTEAGAPSAADGGVAPTATGDDRPRVAVSAKRRAKVGKGGKAAVDDQPEAKPEKKAEPVEAKAAPRAKGKGKDDLDNLIDTAIGSEGKAAAKAKKASPSPAPTPGSNLPEQLTMNEISTGMGKIKGLVQACYDQYQVEGMAKVNFTIGGDGTVKEATIKGKFFGTDTGTCVGSAVKKARFPKFSGKPMTIAGYPFQLQ